MMAEALPLKPGVPWYDITVPLTNAAGGTETFTFEFMWNVRDESYYFHMYAADGSPILHGVRVVLGQYLGRLSQHPWFQRNALVAMDVTRKGKEATLDNFGITVLMYHVTDHDIIVGRGVIPQEFQPSTELTDG